MAKLLLSGRLAFTLCMVLAFCVLLLSMETIMGEEIEYCKKRSKTWSGACVNSDGCNNQCKIWEGADHGACHFDFPGSACFCYFRKPC